jgi:hypothetical protein
VLKLEAERGELTGLALDGRHELTDNGQDVSLSSSRRKDRRDVRRTSRAHRLLEVVLIDDMNWPGATAGQPSAAEPAQDRFR